MQPRSSPVTLRSPGGLALAGRLGSSNRVGRPWQLQSTPCEPRLHCNFLGLNRGQVGDRQVFISLWTWRWGCGRAWVLGQWGAQCGKGGVCCVLVAPSGWEAQRPPQAQCTQASQPQPSPSLPRREKPPTLGEPKRLCGGWSFGIKSLFPSFPALSSFRRFLFLN